LEHLDKRQEIKEKYLTPEEREKYISKHLQGAVVRSVGGFIMVGFCIALFSSTCLTVESCAGGILSGLFVIVMNLPAIVVIRLIRHRLLFDIASFFVNFLEIIGYTAVIYFLGGIRAAYLVPIYAAMITYVGIIAPKRYPYILAATSTVVFGAMVIAEHLEFIPHQNYMVVENYSLIFQVWIIDMVAASLFGIAVISSYSAGIVKNARNDLLYKNRELEDSRWELSLYSQNLESSEWKYRRIFESIQNIYLEIEKNGTITEISPSVERVVGIEREKIIGRTIFDGFYPYPSRVRKLMDEVLASGEVKDREIPFFGKDGKLLILSLSAWLVKDEYRPEGRIVMDVSDVTARHIAEKARRESEERYRMLIEELKDVVFIVTPEGYIEYTSPASIEFGGYDPEKAVGMHVSEFIADEKGIEKAVELLLEILTHKKTIESEFLYKPLNKPPFYVVVTGTPILNHGDVTGLLCIMRDISHRKLAEEQIRILTQELMNIQEKERKRIACDLHDDVAQNLASLMISCETFFDGHDSIGEVLKLKMRSFSGILKQSLQSVRDLSYELRPPGLDQLGLIKTLDRYCEDFSEKQGIRIDFFPVGMGAIAFDPDTEINIYRLIQESLNNVKKHAEADYVVVKFVASVPDIIIRIQDNGKGFDVDERLVSAVAERRMGLQSMTQRVAFLNGTIKINSRPGEGTTIIVNIPSGKFRKNEPLPEPLP
jgi:PAS domain S-box-containing protein